MNDPVATFSPTRPAKNERPFTTASPESAEEMTDNRVETTRRSNTTVTRSDGGLIAPSMRVDRRTASWAARSASSPAKPRATLNPVPVWLSVPSPAMADADRKAEVRRVNARMPVVEARATSIRSSP